MSSIFNELPRSSAFCLLLLGVLFNSHAEASVVYTDRSSTISVSDCPGLTPCTGQSQGTTSLNPFSAMLSVNDAGVATAAQQSTLSANSISVNLSVSQSEENIASSTFQVDFVLDTATSFTISGSSGFIFGAGSADVTLTGPTSLTSPFGIGISSCGQFGMTESCTYSNTTYGAPLNVQTLNPGAYSLYVSASATGPEEVGTGGASADVTLSFAPSPVPIPASGTLLLSALGMLGLLFSSGLQSSRLAMSRLLRQ
jgi:hypothetical protein